MVCIKNNDKKWRLNFLCLFMSKVMFLLLSNLLNHLSVIIMNNYSLRKLLLKKLIHDGI